MTRDSLIRLCFLSFSLLVLLHTAPAAAQVSMSMAAPSPGAPTSMLPQENSPQSVPPTAMMDEEVTIIRDDFAGKYNLSTLENLSKLYWRLGAFDFDDDMAIANYLKINDCKIFTEYLNDDLEWKEIVSVMKDHLRRERDTFPLNYQFVLELHLGRYDVAQDGFPLVDKTGFINSKRIEVDSIDRNRDVCYDQNAIKDYPKRMVILLDKPFTLDFLRMDEHVAQAYILRKKSEYLKMDEAVRVNHYERDAYLRLRVTFTQYHGNLRGDDGENLAILYGRVDGYEIFEDPTQKRLMLSVNLLNQKEEPQISTPEDGQEPPGVSDVEYREGVTIP